MARKKAILFLHLLILIRFCLEVEILSLPQRWHLHPCFCPTNGGTRIFHRDLLLQQQVHLYSFFPLVGVDPTVVLHLKEGRGTTRDTPPTE